MNIPKPGDDNYDSIWDEKNGRYYDRSGNEMTMREMTELFEKKKKEKEDYGQVAETYCEDGKWISTVWLGLNHAFLDGPPLIFESIVFEWGPDTAPDPLPTRTTPEVRDPVSGEVAFSKRTYTVHLGDEVDMQRYSTEEEALAGHKELVEKYTTKEET